MPKITDYTTLTAAASNDVLVIVDVSDTTQSGAGTTKQITTANLAGGLTPMTTLGDLTYEDATPVPVRLAGNTTGTKKYLTQTGTGAVSAAPGWNTISAGDVPTLNQNTSGNAATATNLAGGATFPAYTAPAVVALTDASTISVNAALGNDFRVTIGASRTMGAPSNPVDGQRIDFQITQGGSGSFTITWTSTSGGYAFGTTGAPTLTTTAGKIDIIGFIYNSAASKWLYAGSMLGF